jgi:hypothetical protein
MEKAKIEVTIVKTDTGKIRLLFNDGSLYPVPDEMCNIGLISSLEVELKYALKAQTKSDLIEGEDSYYPNFKINTI